MLRGIAAIVGAILAAVAGLPPLWQFVAGIALASLGERRR
jgi:hypothetical protein